ELIFFILFDYFGLWGIAILLSAITILSYLLLLKISQSENKIIISGFVLIIMTFISKSQFGTVIRVQTFSFLFLLITIFISQKQLQNKNFVDFKKWFLDPNQLSMFFVFLMWVNIHGGFIIGYLFLIVRYIIYILFNIDKNSKKPITKKIIY